MFQTCYWGVMSDYASHEVQGREWTVRAIGLPETVCRKLKPKIREKKEYTDWMTSLVFNSELPYPSSGRRRTQERMPAEASSKDIVYDTVYSFFQSVLVDRTKITIGRSTAQLVERRSRM